MPPPRIFEIELDPGPWAGPSFRDCRPAGEPLTGRVRLVLDVPLACRALRIWVGWRTEGPGDADGETAFEATLHEGEIAAGERNFPFQASLPLAPLSYAGRHFTLVWTAAARLDVGSPEAPAAVKRFFLVPA